MTSRRTSRSPPPPLVTSTLQQEAARGLGLSVSDAMRAARALYEAGFISYMRMDRAAMSAEAVDDARRAAGRLGPAYVAAPAAEKKCRKGRRRPRRGGSGRRRGRPTRRSAPRSRTTGRLCNPTGPAFLFFFEFIVPTRF